MLTVHCDICGKVTTESYSTVTLIGRYDLKINQDIKVDLCGSCSSNPTTIQLIFDDTFESFLSRVKDVALSNKPKN